MNSAWFDRLRPRKDNDVKLFPQPIPEGENLPPLSYEGDDEMSEGENEGFDRDYCPPAYLADRKELEKDVKLFPADSLGEFKDMAGEEIALRKKVDNAVHAVTYATANLAIETDRMGEENALKAALAFKAAAEEAAAAVAAAAAAARMHASSPINSNIVLMTPPESSAEEDMD